MASHPPQKVSGAAGTMAADSGLVRISRGRAGGRRAGPSVLLLDAASRATLVCARTLGSSGLRVAASETSNRHNVPTFASRWCELRAVVPNHSDPVRYVDGLLELLDAFPAPVTIPVSDASVEALRGRRVEIESRTTLALMDEAGLAVTMDKERTLRVAEELGVPVPRGVTVHREAEALEAALQLGLPLVVKPATSWASDSPRMGRLVCEVVLTREELQAAVARVTEAGSAALLQQWAGGRREAVSLFLSDGRVWGRFAQVAHRMVPALGGSSVVRESIAPPDDSTRLAEQLALAMGLNGYIEVEFRRDASNRPLLMEINPRLSASVEIAVRAGVDFPLLIYSAAVGTPLRLMDTYRVGLRMRWLGGDVRYLRQVLREHGRPDVPSLRSAVGTQLADTLRRTSYDYLDVKDLLPAASAVAGLLRAANRELLGPSRS